MPKVVDHDERRDELLASIRRLIAREGLDGASNRAIAQETGWSTGTLAHYFADKDDVLRQTLEQVHRDQEQRMLRSRIPGDPVETLRQLALATLPIDTIRREEAVVEISFWARSIHSLELSRLQLAFFDRWTETIKAVVGEATALGLLRPHTTPAAATAATVAFIDGLQLEATLQPRRFDRKAVPTIVNDFLNAWFDNDHRDP